MQGFYLTEKDITGLWKPLVRLQQNIQIGKLYLPEMEKSTKEKH